MEHIVNLKNSKKVKLQYNFMINELMDDVYPEGYDALVSDYKKGKNLSKALNCMMYAVIAANMDETIEYRELLKQVDLKCLRVVENFVKEYSKEFEEFKKKDHAYYSSRKKKKSKKQIKVK